MPDSRREKIPTVTCRRCKTRYDVRNMTPGVPFSCNHCGDILFAPGTNDQLGGDAGIPFGQIAVQKGFLTNQQLADTLQEQEDGQWGQDRLGDILLRKKLLTAHHVAEIRRAQGSQIIHLVPGYRIISRLGVGGMGMVYKAVHLPSSKTVAMKVLTPKLAAKKGFSQRFHREARAAIDMDHPHIVKGFDVGEIAGIHYFVMEYVHGKSIARVLKKRGTFGERRSLDIIRQIASALVFADSRGILHRDIKPDNIMITRDGTAKLADYGLVKFMDTMDDASLTTEGQVMGTPHYISPEQACGRKDLDIRSDLYSLGATLYNMLTGETLYEGANASVILSQHVNAPLPDLAAKHPELSEKTVAVVLRMLAKKREDRFSSASDCLTALDETFQALGNADNSHETEIPLTPTPMLDDPGGEEIEENLLETIDEDVNELSRNAKLFLAAGLSIILVGLLVIVLHLWEKKFASPETPPPDVAQAPAPPPPPSAPEKLPPPDIPKPPVAVTPPPSKLPPEEEDTAAVASAESRRAMQEYLQALSLERDAQKKELAKIIAAYEETEAAELAQQQLDSIRASELKETAIRRRREREAREMEAKSRFTELLRNTDPTSKQYITDLKAFAQEYKDTDVAYKAKVEINRIEKRLDDQRREKEAEIQEAKRREAEAKRFARNTELERVRTLFFEYYQSAFFALDYEKAQAVANRLANDTRYPELQPLGKACGEDIKALESFLLTVVKALATYKNKEVTLKFGTKSVTGIYLGLRNGTVYLMIQDSVPYHRPLMEMDSDLLEDLFRKGYDNIGAQPDVVLGLFALSQKDWPRARRHFRKIASQDTLSAHHLSLLKWQNKKTK